MAVSSDRIERPFRRVSSDEPFTDSVGERRGVFGGLVGELVVGAGIVAHPVGPFLVGPDLVALLTGTLCWSHISTDAWM